MSITSITDKFRKLYEFFVSLDFNKFVNIFNLFIKAKVDIKKLDDTPEN